FEPPIVASTCLQINNWLFSYRDSFDYCIIDEASQIMMPICLGPLRLCEKFILVGDHFQLPPLVISPNAKGLSESLFKILSEKYPEGLSELTYQYRMCKEVMLLSNTLVYNGKLKAGNETVSSRFLPIDNPHLIDGYKTKFLDGQKDWVRVILREDSKVLFLNNDKVPALETAFNDQVTNSVESELVKIIVESLLACGVDESSIGVMSLYRGQLRLLNRLLYRRKKIEILTADQFQGRDKDCIIISLVRSNPEHNVGALLNEWRRINVAMTRSRSKLIVIGSRLTLESSKTIRDFILLAESNGWSYNLPENAEKMYKF
ncbi:bifunctional ATP-dependent DNA helicase/ssDNA endodeoxyribonuclease DNA2, partial [Ascoidea rubescens DSM 1968]